MCREIKGKQRERCDVDCENSLEARSVHRSPLVFLSASVFVSFVSFEIEIPTSKSFSGTLRALRWFGDDHLLLRRITASIPVASRWPTRRVASRPDLNLESARAI